MKCTQYGSYSQAAFKNARAMVFISNKLGGTGSSFQLSSNIFREGCPCPDLTHRKLARGCLMSAIEGERRRIVRRTRLDAGAERPAFPALPVAALIRLFLSAARPESSATIYPSPCFRLVASSGMLEFLLVTSPM